MIRICSPQLGISPDSNLGGEVHDREMLKALASLGVQIDIILPLGKKHQNHKNWHFYYLPVPVVYPPWLFNILILPYLFWIYRQRHFQILRVHSSYFVGPAAVFFKTLLPKVKLVVSYHHLEENGIFNLIDRLLINRFDLLVTVSNKTQKEIIQRFWPNREIVVIPNGVDQKFKPLPKSPADTKTMLYLGQLIERKNIPFLFRIMKLLPENYRLIIAGDGPLRGELERLAPAGVTFLGKVKEEDKLQLYNQADIFLYPSKKEGFGLSILEALACGLPVITLPGLVENMPVVEVAENEKLWAKAILGQKTAKTRLKANNYSWSASARKYLAALVRITK